MGVPPLAAARRSAPPPPWQELDATAKRSRLLAVSREVFAREGLEAPMPAIADAAGVGVGSIYRQFPSKLDLLAALVGERLEEVEIAAGRATGDPGGHWSGLVGLIWHFATLQSEDLVVAEAMSCAQVGELVEPTRARTNEALDRLLDGAREEGRLRADVTARDLRFLFAAARATEKLEAGSWRRMIELGVDAFDAGRERRPAGERVPAGPGSS